LVGCAPCQPFSKYSQRYRKNGHRNNKWSLLYNFSEKIQEILPEIVSMENVPELAKEELFHDFTNMLKMNGYFVSWSVVFCPNYGVPQRRKRLVLLASKFGEIKLVGPRYTKDNYLTVRNTIGDLPIINAGQSCKTDPLHCAAKLSNINLLRIRQSHPGGTWRDWDKALQLNCHKKKSGNTYPSVYGRMTWDEPAPTITTQFYGYGNGRFGHPEQNRALSLREGAVLQSFPMDYIFSSPSVQLNRKHLGIQIGNAVPVLLAYAIGESIICHLREVERDV